MMVSVRLCVLGGPAVGDIRSRCLRLSDESTSEALSVRKLLGHRLPIDPSEAKLEWWNAFLFCRSILFILVSFRPTNVQIMSFYE
jgi:hypothetical protein